MTNEVYRLASIVLGAAALLLAGCSKDIERTFEGELVDFTLSAEFDATKVALNSDGKTPNWESGDQILVLDAELKPVGTDGIFTLSSGQGTAFGKFAGAVCVGQKPTFAIYPASAATVSGSSSVTSGTLLGATGDKTTGTIKAAVMLGTSSDGKNLTFSNACAVLKFNTGKYGKSDGAPAIASVRVSASYGTNAAPVTGAFNIDWTATPPTIAAASSDAETWLTIDLPSDLRGNNKDVYIPIFPLPMQSSVAPSMKFEFKNIAGATAEVSYVFSDAISANTLKGVGTAQGMEFVVIPLPGVFTVNGDSKKVRFSQGNLTYNVFTTAWSFYENQYDCASGYDPNLISLFNWGYNATKSIIPDCGSSDNVSSYLLSQEQDWGSRIGDGNSWRTLTSSEWQYLINSSSRMNNGKVCYSNAIEGIAIEGQTYKGVFIYPDDYNGDVVSNSMTWAQINAAGIVFLPAAGYRSGSEVFSVGNWGCYWSSDGHSGARADAVDFDNFGDVYVYCESLRCNFGYSVRLITECQ